MFFVTDLRLSVNMNIHVGSRFVRFTRVFELSFGTGTNLTFKCPHIAGVKSKAKVSRFPSSNYWIDLVDFIDFPADRRRLKDVT